MLGTGAVTTWALRALDIALAGPSGACGKTLRHMPLWSRRPIVRSQVHRFHRAMPALPSAFRAISRSWCPLWRELAHRPKWQKQERYGIAKAGSYPLLRHKADLAQRSHFVKDAAAAHAKHGFALARPARTLGGLAAMGLRMMGCDRFDHAAGVQRHLPLAQPISTQSRQHDQR
mmetsp:Transcript_22728/g.37575  ORF Transcript_22728/g.37575 Transcript_22728/m.37575 type:complete len:174 (-) Transcript_22728:1139-1660(-)